MYNLKILFDAFPGWPAILEYTGIYWKYWKPLKYLKIYLKIGVFWKIYWRDSSISFSILENTGNKIFRIPLSLIYWNMLENCIHKNCTYLNILEIRFCHILEFEKYTGKHTGIYWNFIKKFAGHPAAV